MASVLHPYLRVLIVWLGVLLIWLMAIRLAGEALFGPDYSLASHAFRAVLASALAIPLVVWARRRLDGGRLAGLGLGPLRTALKPFAVGALAFLVPSALGFALVLGLGWASVAPAAPVMEIAAFIPLLVVLVIVYEALPEELAFRGYIYKALAERHQRITAVAVQAVLFGLWGMLLWTLTTGSLALDRLVMFTAVAFVLGLVRATTGSVWAAIGLHTAFQTVAQLVLNTERGHFIVEGADMVQLVAIGVVPFSLATIIVGLFYRDPVAWREPDRG